MDLDVELLALMPHDSRDTTGPYIAQRQSFSRPGVENCLMLQSRRKWLSREGMMMAREAGPRPSDELRANLRARLSHRATGRRGTARARCGHRRPHEWHSTCCAMRASRIAGDTIQPMAEQTLEHAQPLTVLAEDEIIFRDSVREFAHAQVRPLVREMDEQAKIPRALVDKLFDLGVMAIEIPETYGGAGASFFHAVLAVEELSRVDPSVGVLVDVQNTLVVNALMRFGNEDIKRRYLTRLAANTVGAYALSEAGSGSDAFALTPALEVQMPAATATRSPAGSCGSPTATRPTCSWSSPRSIRRRATAASLR